MALGDVIAALAVSLTLETAALEKGADLAEKRMNQMRGRMEKFGKKVSGIGKTLSLSVTAPLAAFGYTAVKAAQESAEAMGQVDAALKSMGGAAGRTSEQLAELASKQMRTSLYDDDEILRKVTANLLTFGNVAGDNFDRAQQAAIDLSARLGQDLQQSTVMIGKALNDPIQGLTALRRVGIQFTEQQEEQIKKMAEAGDAAGAQAIMLQELERQFKGSAQAMRDADPMAAAKMSFAEFQETIGEKLLPILPVVADAIIKVLDAFSSLSPEMQQAVVIGAAVAAALGPVLSIFGALVTVGAPLLAFLGSLGPVLAVVGKSLLLIALNPAVLALAAVLGGIYLAWKNWDKIEPILRNLYLGAKKWITDNLGKVLHGILNPIETVKNAFFNLYDAVVGHSYIPDMVNGIAAQMDRLEAVMVAPVTKATSKASQAFREMAAEVKGLLDRLFPEAAAGRQFRAEDALLAGAGLSPEQLKEAQRRLLLDLGEGGALPTPDFGGKGGPLDEGLKNLDQQLESLGKRATETTVRVAKSFKDMANETLSALGRLSSSIKSGGFLDILDAVIGLGLQLGSVGAFGKKIAANINRSIPAYANGTGFHRGGLAVVGERGPELVSMPRGSRVTPNSKIGRGDTINNFYGPGAQEFWGRIAAGDIQAASAGAQGGVALMGQRNFRRLA